MENTHGSTLSFEYMLARKSYVCLKLSNTPFVIELDRAQLQQLMDTLFDARDELDKLEKED